MIKAENITKAFNGGSVQVLKGVSLHIEEGEFAVITGASGSGKSTLMNVLSGLERADGGTLVCAGENLTDMSDSALTDFRRRVVGFVFQQYYLLPHLSVLNNVKLGAELSKNSDFVPVINAVGLGDKLNKKPSELSGGEQQRVSIARAIAKRPKILFLDEPTGALDEATGREILDYIAKIKAELNFTVVMVTHNLNIAEMADTQIKMNSGKIVSVVKNTHKKSAYEIGW